MAGFAGKWLDDLPAGKCPNFDAFVSKMGMSDKDIEDYRGYQGSQVTKVDGENWSYTYDFGGMSKTHTFKIGITNPKDTDIEGHEFEMTPTLEGDRKMTERTKTWRPNGVFTTIMKRTLNDAGDKQDGELTHEESGASMTFTMSRV